MERLILYDRDSRFMSTFWRRLHKAMGIQVNFSTAFHLQTNGQSKRTIQKLKELVYWILNVARRNIYHW